MKYRAYPLGKSHASGLKLKKIGLSSLALAVVGLVAGGIGMKYATENQGDALASDNVARISDLITINPEYEKYLQDVANGKGGEYELIPNKYIPATSGVRARGMNIQRGNNDSSLPASYNLIDEGFGTTIKNQGADGICWAYAITTAVESYLKKHNIANTEFSPKQLDYLFAAGTPHGNLISSMFDEELAHVLGSGYNFTLASYGLSNGLAPVNEAAFFTKLQTNDAELQEYESWKDFSSINHINILFGSDIDPYDKPMNYTTVTSVENRYLIAEYEDYPFEHLVTMDKVKASVRDNGAAYVGSIAPYTDNCYDEATKTIVDYGADVCGTTSGHAMAVVGWDDNHAYTDPATGAAKTGAFILQNSYGEDDLLSSYGITYDRLVERGYYDPSAHSQAENDRLKDAIENYDADSIVYLAYDHAETTLTDFALLTDIRPNQYDGFYTIADNTKYVGAEIDDENPNAEIFTYTTGDQTETVKAVALSSVAPFYPGYELKYQLGIKSGNGDFVSLGEFTMASGTSAMQKFIDIDPVEVTGEFQLAFAITVNGMALPLDSDTAPLFTMSAYTLVGAEDPVIVPDTGGGEPATSDVAAPNTGASTRANNFGYAVFLYALPILGVLVLTTYGAVAKSRHHKVSFKK